MKHRPLCESVPRDYRDEIDSHICMEKAEAMRKRLVELVSDDVRGIRSDFTVFRRNDEKA